MTVIGIVLGIYLGMYIMKERIKKYSSKQIDNLKNSINENKRRKSELERKLKNPSLDNDTKAYYSSEIQAENVIIAQKSWEIESYQQLVKDLCG